VNDFKRGPNSPCGERGGYRKLTVTLPPDIYERLVQESARRKIEGRPNQLPSALRREALSDYLERIGSNRTDQRPVWNSGAAALWVGRPTRFAPRLSHGPPAQLSGYGPPAQLSGFGAVGVSPVCMTFCMVSGVK